MHHSVIPRLVFAATALAPALSQGPVAVDALGPATTQRPQTSARAVSADGTALVGWEYSFTQAVGVPFRWTEATGRVPLPIGGFLEGLARGASRDGSVVCGSAWGPTPWDPSSAVLWDSGGTLQVLAFGAEARAVSEDGLVVVGQLDPPPGNRAFRWTATSGVVELSALGPSFPHVESIAHATNADGSVVVGEARTSAQVLVAFRWTAASGMQVLSGGRFIGGVATGVSSDGSVVVGSRLVDSGGALHREAFYWTAASGPIDLGTLGGSQSEATGVSGDGRVVVGHSRVTPQSTETRAFLWTAATGMLDLGVLVPPTPGSYAFGVSADGSVVGGQSFNGLGNVTAVRYLVHGQAGTLGCSGRPNSVGSGGALSLAGEASIAAGSLSLVATGLPASTTALGLASLAPGFSANPGGSQGDLCLGGPIGRFTPRAASLAGALRQPLDLAALPTSSGSVAGQAGQTWHFQVWYRDTNPATTSNFTGSVAIVLQ